MTVTKEQLDEWRKLAQQADIKSHVSMSISDALRHAMGEIERLQADTARYRRLRIIGVAPLGTSHLREGLVMCFSNLDAFVDADIQAQPSRGEAKLELLR